MGNDETYIHKSSGNVFADLGLPDAEDLITRARLGATLIAIARHKQFTQKQLALKLGIGQPKVSALLNSKFEGFSMERLIHFLTLLSFQVSIEIHPTNHSEQVESISGSICSFEHTHLVSKMERESRSISSLARYAVALGIAVTSPPILLPRLG